MEYTKVLSGDSRYSIKLTVTEALTLAGLPYDTVNNTSDVYYILTATKSSGSGYYSGSTINDVIVNINLNEVVNINVAYDFRNSTPKTITLASGYVRNIPHETDGKKTIAVSGYFADNANSLGSGTASGNLTLTTIPRASKISATSGYIEGDSIITINKTNSSFTHTLKWHVSTTEGDLDYTIVEKTTQSSYIWTIPSAMLADDYYQAFPNSTKIPTGVICDTYNGDTLIGTYTTIMYVYPDPDICSPVVTGVVVDTNANTITLTEDDDVLVKYMSTAVATISATPQKYATIANFNKKINGTVATSNQLTVANVSNNTFTFYAKDSRELITTAIINKNMVPYVLLTFNSLLERNEPTDNKINLTFSGNYYNGGFKFFVTSDVSYNGAKTYYTLNSSYEFEVADISEFASGVTYYEVTNNNTLTISYRYKEYGAETWGEWATVSSTVSGNTYSNGATPILLGSSFDYAKQYDFELKAEDELNVIYQQNLSVDKGKPVYNAGEDEEGNNFFNINDGKLQVDETDIISKSGTDYIINKDLIVGDLGKKISEMGGVTSSDNSVNDWITVTSAELETLKANNEIQEGRMYNVTDDESDVDSLENMFRVVPYTFASGTPSAGAKGYVTISAIIPMGYTSFGMHFSSDQISSFGGAQFTPIYNHIGTTGVQTIYILYYYPTTMTISRTVDVKLICIKTDYYNVVS